MQYINIQIILYFLFTESLQQFYFLFANIISYKISFIFQIKTNYIFQIKTNYIIYFKL